MTGAAGFIGSHLCKRLVNDGHDVIGIDNMSVGFYDNIVSLENEERFDFWEDDIRNYFRVDKDIDVIYHLAARGETYWCQENPLEAIDVNINGTVAMLEFAKACKVNHFIFADTSAEYDNIPIQTTNSITNYPSREFDECSHKWGVWMPRGFYSITKNAASQFVRRYGNEYGFGTTLIRPFNVYGPSMNLIRDIPPVVGSFTKSILEGSAPYIFGTGEKRRDFIFINDAIELLSRCLTHRNKIDTLTVNMGTGENYSIYEVYEQVCKEILGIDENWPEIEYREDKDYEAEITLADISIARRNLDWEPRIDFENGVKRTVNGIRLQLGY